MNLAPTGFGILSLLLAIPVFGAIVIALIPEEFQKAVAGRREKLTDGQSNIGCPTCGLGKKAAVVAAR